MKYMNTCRICKGIDRQARLHKIGWRHWVHAKCGIEKWGEKFLDKLPHWELEKLPFFLVKEAGLEAAVRARLEAK